MQDRGYIKWAPFNSVINDNVVLNELTKKRNKIYKPTLSEDQIDFLNEKIFEAYTNHLKVNIFIYSNFNILKLSYLYAPGRRRRPFFRLSPCTKAVSPKVPYRRLYLIYP